MSSSYRKTVEKLAEQGDVMNNMPCHWCSTPTARSTLAQYGARCFSCYEAYCRERHGGAKYSAPVPNLLRPKAVPLDPAAIEAAKRDQAKRVEDYARRNGLTLHDSATLLDGGRRAFTEPARFAEEDRA